LSEKRVGGKGGEKGWRRKTFFLAAKTYGRKRSEKRRGATITEGVEERGKSD